MRNLATVCILLFAGCTSHRPSWVLSLRSGENTLKVANGNKILFRETGRSCSEAIQKAQRLVAREYEGVPVLEVYYQEETFCAVTLSIPSSAPKAKPLPLKIGMTKRELERALNTPYIHYDFDYRHPCWTNFDQASYTELGTATVCMKHLRVVGWIE